MPATTYKIWGNVGAPVGSGVSGAIHVGVAAVAKKAIAGEPNIVINELICSSLARSLYLPCPPGILLEHGGDTYFCSMNFNVAGQALPPISPKKLLQQYPRLCWGIILFDVLVMNPDRHEHNLSFDTTTGAVQIFDHSRAFMPLTWDVDSVMQSHKGKLGLQVQCLAQEISDIDGFDMCCDRIEALPDYAIEESVSQICEIGFPVGKKSDLIAFFKDRRSSIRSIAQSHWASFPKMAPLPVAPPPALPAPPAQPASSP